MDELDKLFEEVVAAQHEENVQVAESLERQRAYIRANLPEELAEPLITFMQETQGKFPYMVMTQTDAATGIFASGSSAWPIKFHAYLFILALELEEFNHIMHAASQIAPESYAKYVELMEKHEARRDNDD